jgi:hypothetical protein
MDYSRHKQAAVEYVKQVGLGPTDDRVMFDVTAVDAKHDRLVPDGVLVLVEDQNGDQLALLVHEHLAEVAQDSLDEDAWEKGTAA